MALPLLLCCKARRAEPHGPYQSKVPVQTTLMVLLCSLSEAQPLPVMRRNTRDSDGVPTFGFSGEERSWFQAGTPQTVEPHDEPSSS